MDYNATTPAHKEVLTLLSRIATECYGNPSSSHILGRMSRACIDDARRKVALSLGCDDDEICFTAGGSESNSLAIKGVADGRSSGHIVSTCIEHSSVKRTCDYLATRNFTVTCLPVDWMGCVDPKDVEDAIQDDTFLITMMWANNETGQIQPVEEVARIARDRGITFHTDAVQAFGKIPVNVRSVPVDLLSISGHKIYGPKGVGALYVRRGVKLVTQVHGGGQEQGLRSGTENVAGCAALGEACRLCTNGLDEWTQKVSALRDELERGILERISETSVNGDPVRRVPNTSSISFHGVDSSQLVVRLDEAGFAVSGGSACKSTTEGPSTVLTIGMGLSADEAAGTIRFSLGHGSEASHIAALHEVMPGIVERLRGAPSGKLM